MPVYQQMTLFPKLGVVEISTLWHFRLPLLIQMFIKVVSSPRLSVIGMPYSILWSHLLKMQRIVLLSSLLRWELGTNSLITGPGEWLSFRRFTSKLSWSSFHCPLQNCLRHARGSWDVAIPYWVSVSLPWLGDNHALQLHSGFCYEPPRSSHGLCRKCSEVSYSIESQGLGSFSQFLLSRSSSHRHKGR